MDSYAKELVEAFDEKLIEKISTEIIAYIYFITG